MTQKLNYTIFNDYLSLRIMRRFFFFIDQIIGIIFSFFWHDFRHKFL
nr:MAG TPA: hypothetical protein [Caudoviricetes sp.]